MTQTEPANDDIPLQQRGDEYLINMMMTPEGIDDPAPWYKKLRNDMPVFQSASGSVFLTRYEDCRAVLRDNRFGKVERNADATMLAVDKSDEMTKFRQAQQERRRQGPQSMLFLNPPDHTRMRSLVSRAFTPRRIEGMRASITSLSEECMDALAEHGGGDAIDILGWVPINVIGELVGVPRSDWSRFRELVTASAVSLEPTATLDDLKSAEVAFSEMWGYFLELVAERRVKPGEDLISGLLEVEVDGDKLSDAEVVSTAVLLFGAGMETTQNLIGNGLGALFKNPEQHQLLWEQPELVDLAVEEMLRWDSPVQIDGRGALEDADVAGLEVPKGASIVTLLGAANRDPAQFSNADAFDVTRDEGPPMSFASGIHFCLGANLARAEGQEVFAGLIRRFSSVSQAGPLVNRNRMTLRGYEAVPVEVTPR
jgi:cytochrome P450